MRQLMADLERAGFMNQGGKGSHRNYIHPKGLRVTLSGNPGHDAKPYQEREVLEAFLNLPAPQRKIVREVILTFAQAFPATDSPR